MNWKGIIVVVVCTAGIIAATFTINVIVSGAEVTQTRTVDVKSANCPSDSECPAFTVTRLSLDAVNYTDELGPAGYAVLSIEVEGSGGSPISGLGVYFDDVLVGNLSGPLLPGQSKAANFTLPETLGAQVTGGNTYQVLVQGTYAGGSTWRTASVRATETNLASYRQSHTSLHLAFLTASSNVAALTAARTAQAASIWN